MSSRVSRVALLAAVAAACTVKPTISNTGYTGTWLKQSSPYQRSTISILRNGDRYLFRWSQRSTDGKWQIRCDWDGRCEEFVDGEKTSDYTFRTWVDPTTSHLMVECTGKVFKPDPLDVHYIDEWVLEPDGKTVHAYTVDSYGQKFEGDHRPMHSYSKVSDTVADPPALSKG